MTTVPAHLPQLANHPDGPNIEDWAIYEDHAYIIESHARHSRTRKTFAPFIESVTEMGASYRPEITDPSEIGYGRTILASRAAILASLPTGPKWADKAREELATII